MGRFLGLDIGDKRIGVALSDPTKTLASPMMILERSTDKFAIDSILQIVYDRDVQRIVIGLPRSMNGRIGHQAEKVQSFAEELRQQTDIPIEYRDERLTTVTAVRLKQEASKRKPNKKTKYDAMAAAIILQDYLEEKTVENL